VWAGPPVYCTIAWAFRFHLKTPWSVSFISSFEVKKKTMENSPWHVYKIKKPWEVSPYPQLLIIFKN
jgi:hypothetical protein